MTGLICVAGLLAVAVASAGWAVCAHAGREDDADGFGDEMARQCGCRYVLRPGEVTFTVRCDEHRPMCRPIEEWEIDLLLGTDHDSPDAEFDERRLP